MFASIISHLQGSHQRKSYFISRDSDFDDQNVITELGGLGCVLVHDFTLGLQFLKRDLSSTGGQT